MIGKVLYGCFAAVLLAACLVGQPFNMQVYVLFPRLVFGHTQMLVLVLVGLYVAAAAKL